jgi:hypothetical protein
MRLKIMNLYMSRHHYEGDAGSRAHASQGEAEG